MDSNLNIKPFLFQTFVFDPRKGSITKNKGEEIFMEPRLKALFQILLNNKNDVVTRDELMSFVWKNTVVSEESISKAVSDLRKFISKNDISNFKITTISKLGYKLEVEETLTKTHKYSKKLLKLMVYSLGIIALIIILIRAFRYEQ